MSLHDYHAKQTLEEILAELSEEIDTRTVRSKYLATLVSARTAEMITGQLRGTAETIGKSANELGPKLDRLNQELGETKAKIETAGQKLTIALAEATAEFQTASTQSGRLGRRLNWLTTALFFAATVTAGATIFQACETKRQTDLQEQIQQQKRSSQAVPKPPAESNPSAPVPKK